MKIYKNILVVGGLHGDEPTGVQVAKEIIKRNIRGISAVMGHPEAIKANKRFLETDLNRSFGSETPTSLEEKLAEKLERLVRGRDLVIDVHNTKARGTTCTIVTSEPSDEMLRLTSHFGFDKLVIMPPSGALISKTGGEAISLEIASDEIRKRSVQTIVGQIVALKQEARIERGKIRVFKYAGRVMATSLKRLEIDKREIKNFGRLGKRICKKLNLPSDGNYLPIFFKVNKNEETAFTLIREVNQVELEQI